MKTNRQWLSEMDDRTLAEFLTFGILIKRIDYHDNVFVLSIHDIAGRYTSSISGIEQWLSKPQEYEIVKGGE
jgi:hypothetical protein